jgi:hypothetical protein
LGSGRASAAPERLRPALLRTGIAGARMRRQKMKGEPNALSPLLPI